MLAEKGAGNVQRGIVRGQICLRNFPWIYSLSDIPRTIPLLLRTSPRPRTDNLRAGGYNNNNNNNNSNNNNQDNVYGAVIMTQSRCESLSGSRDECRTALDGCRPLEEADGLTT